MLNRTICMTAVFLAFLVPILSLADQDDLSQRYFKIIRQTKSGDTDMAILELERFYRDNPDHSLADDALFNMGRLQEDRGDFHSALETYELLVKGYPNSRNARRGSIRLNKLTEQVAAGEEPLRIYKDILRNYRIFGPEKSYEKMKDLLEKYPGFGLRHKVIRWLAEEDLRLEHLEQARTHFGMLVSGYPGTKNAFFGYRGLGHVAVEERTFDEAIEHYAKLADFASVMDFARESSEVYIKQAETFKFFQQLYVAAITITGVLLLLILAGIRWSRLAAGDLKSTLVEIAIYLPIAALLLILLYRASPLFFHPCMVLILATCAVAVVNTLFIAGRNLGYVAGTCYSFVMLLLFSSMAYAIFYAYDVVNVLYDSIRMTMVASGG